MKRLVKVDYDPETKITEQFWFDDETDEVTIRKLQDVDAQIKQNKILMNSHGTRANYGDSNGQHLVARIPMVLIENWKQQGFDWFVSTDKERRAWLDKPENAFLKVRPGKLSGATRNPLTGKVT